MTFVTDVLVRYRNVKRVYGYKLNSYWSNIASVDDYFRTNMDIFETGCEKVLFPRRAEDLFESG